MKMFRPFLRLLVVIVFAQGRIEYDPEIGTISNESPYWSPTRPISIFPQSREEINTQFLLFTVNNTKDYQVVSVRNFTTFQGSYYDGRRPSVFIIHGYTEKGSDPWLVELCQKILERHNVNCFCVDWSGGSFAIYFQAMNNIQLVGGEIAFFIKMTGEKFNSSLSGIRLIGHSLGAQAAGEAGQRCRGIPRITGLDAARPCFENESPEVSIDRSDADLVFGFHTDAGPVGLGMRSLYGHINFFPNGGEKQTGCDGSQIFNLEEASSVPQAGRDVALCNHVTSYYAYISSFHDPSGFMGYCASSYSEFQQGAGFPCSSGSCLGMGYDTDPQNPPDCSVYYLNTGPRSDYPRWRFNVTAKTNGNDSFDGSIAITMYNSTNGSDTREIHSGRIEGGSEYSAFIDIHFPPHIPRVSFFWQKSLLSLTQSPKLGVNRMTLIFGNDGSQYRFCGGGTAEEGVHQFLDPCP